MLISVNADPLGEFGLENQGGQNKRILELCKNLTFKGWYIDVFTTYYNNSELSTIVTSNFKVIRISTGKERNYDDNNFSENELNKFYQNLKKFIINEKITYSNILCFYWLSGVIGIRISKDLNLNFGISYCSLAIYKEQSPSVKHRFTKEKEIAKQASLIIAQSNYEKNIIINRYEANIQNIRVIPGGINEKVFYPKCPKILFVGRPVKQKGLIDLIKALKLLLEYNWELGIIGKKYDEALEEADYTYIEKRIKHYGNITNKEVANIMREYDILVVPSHYENFGNIAIEGMASGLLIIVSKVNGLGELVEHKIDGLHFQPKSPISLAEQIKFALTNNVVEIRKNALEKSKKFQWNILIENYNDILSK